MEEPGQFMQEFICPVCARQGHATWNAEPAGARHILTNLSDGFERGAPRDGADPEIICKGCGATQPDRKSANA